MRKLLLTAVCASLAFLGASCAREQDVTGMWIVDPPAHAQTESALLGVDQWWIDFNGNGTAEMGDIRDGKTRRNLIFLEYEMDGDVVTVHLSKDTVFLHARVDGDELKHPETGEVMGTRE